MGLTIQSVGKCVQDLIFGEKYRLEWRLMRRDTRLLSDYVENRLVVPRVQLALTGCFAAANGNAVQWSADLGFAVARCH